jgi:hypothetical protein
MTKREDLRKEWLAVAELRLIKVEEIRELLSISPTASVEEVLRIMKWWHDNGDGAIPAKLKSQAHRLLNEIHSLNEASLEILDELRPVSPATASLLRYRFAKRNHNGQALAYVYCEDEPGRRSAAKLMSRDEARRIAANIAKLPERKPLYK